MPMQAQRGGGGITPTHSQPGTKRWVVSTTLRLLYPQDKPGTHCTFYVGIRIFNRLRLSLISLKNEKTKFKVALRKYLNTHSFYSVDEFFMYKDGP
jgi:hypothetical protein